MYICGLLTNTIFRNMPLDVVQLYKQLECLHIMNWKVQARPDKWKKIKSSVTALVGSKGTLRTDILKAVPKDGKEDDMKEYSRI